MFLRIQTGFRVLLFCLKLIIAYCVSIPLRLSERYQNIWLISERGDDARDNGYHIFNYICHNHSEINIYYVIDYRSIDYGKVKIIGNTVQHNSFKHFVLFALASTRISTHAWGGDVPVVDYYKKLHLNKLIHKKTIFLQHGITKDFLPSLMYPQIEPDLFICGAEPEYKFVKKMFRHPKGTVQYTGLARFDNLHINKTKDQILIMPTFRKWLQRMTPDEVEESEYIKLWNDVIADEKLIYALERKHLQLIFYPHYEMQKYIDLFKSKNKCIKIANFNDYDVQTLLIESKLLITDYSSVFFDFGYMKKPTIYYHFDRERYIDEHYDFTKGYFNYDFNGFGKVAFLKEELVDAVILSIDREFALEPEYERRIADFFPIYDKHNCERIFEKIKRL